MNSIVNTTKCILVSLLILVCGTVTAQRKPHAHYLCKHPITTVVVEPIATIHVSQRITQRERLEMAVAYLKSNKFLSIKDYSKITGLAKKTAEAELDVFSYASRNPIVMVMTDKKKLYTLKG